MQSLSELAGFELDWAEDGTLRVGGDIQVEEVLSRPLERMRSVALNPASCTPGDRVQYWMYNGLARRRDRERFSITGLRYELTLLYPNPIGRERSKTLGHRHSTPSSGIYDYPEVCEVLHGKAWFLFQTLQTDTRSAPFCAMVEANPGDKVIIPPNLHHLTINAGDEPLLFADVIPASVKGIYQPLTEMRGAGWLNTRDEGWIKNPSYRFVADLEQWPVVEYPDIGILRERSLYQTLVKTPEALIWMIEPAQFPDVFPDVWERIKNWI